MTISSLIIKGFVDRIESIEVQEQDLKEDKRAIYKEAKTENIQISILRRVVRDRRKEPEVLREENDTYAAYARAVGLI